MTLQEENSLLRRWLGEHLRYESGFKRRLYLRPDGEQDKKHFGTPEEAITAALAYAEEYVQVSVPGEALMSLVRRFEIGR